MKALSNKSMFNRVCKELGKTLDKQKAEIAYEAVKKELPNIAQQTEALMLYVLMMEFGFGKKRLMQAHDRFCALMNMPSNVMGKTPTMADAMKVMQDRHDLDFSSIKPDMPEFKDWYDGKA